MDFYQDRETEGPLSIEVRELVTRTPTGTVENKGRRKQGNLGSGERKQEENEYLHFTGKGIRSQES